jgi:hypothetical protein
MEHDSSWTVSLRYQGNGTAPVVTRTETTGGILARMIGVVKRSWSPGASPMVFEQKTPWLLTILPLHLVNTGMHG